MNATARVRVGDSVNDWDFKFPAGVVVAVDEAEEWFEARWTRGGVTYVKRHGMEVLSPRPGKEGTLVNLSGR